MLKFLFTLLILLILLFLVGSYLLVDVGLDLGILFGVGTIMFLTIVIAFGYILQKKL